MKRSTLFAVVLLLLLSHAGAIGPLMIQVVTEASGVSYRFGGASPGMNRDALAAWFARSKPWGSQPVLLYIDAATTFYTVSDLVTLLKETGGVEQFEIFVTAEPKGEPRALVTYALQLGQAQIGSAERKLLPPPASPAAVIQNMKPWTPPPPKLSPPLAK